MRFQLIRTYRGHQDTIYALAGVPNHPKVVSASRDGLIKIWDLRGGSSQTLNKEPEAYPTAISVFPAGFFLVSGTSDGRLKIWNMESGEVVRHMEGHQGSITALTITRNGSYLLSGAQDHTMRIWDALTGTPLHICNGYTSQIDALAVTPDDAFVLAGEIAADQTTGVFKVWDVRTGKAVSDLEQQQGGVKQAAVLRDGKRVISTSPTGDIIVWNRETGQTLKRIETGLGPLAMALAPGETDVVIGTQKPSLQVWSLRTGEKVQQFEQPSHPVTSLAITGDGRSLVVGCSDGSLNFYVRVS